MNFNQAPDDPRWVFDAKTGCRRKQKHQFASAITNWFAICQPPTNDEGAFPVARVKTAGLPLLMVAIIARVIDNIPACTHRQPDKSVQASGKDDAGVSRQKAAGGADAAGESKLVHRTEDVIYGRKNGMALTMDVFQPPGPNGCGIIFVVNGGWFSSKDTPRMQNVQPDYYRMFLDRGCTVFAVVTSSQPKFTIPEERYPVCLG